MAQNQYKKNYEGDYKKSYKDYAAWAKEAAQKKQEYQTISKKLDDSPYNKKERSDYYDITGRKPKESERVYAEGGQRQQPSQTNKQERRQTTQESRKPVMPQTAPPIQTIPQPQARVEEKQVPHTPPLEIEDDGNYNYHNPPIQQIGVNKYRNLKTNKEIGVDEARQVLKLAGYTPKGGFGIGTLIFIYIILNIVLSIAAPFVAIVYGVIKMLTTYSTWVKQGATKFYTCNIPASKEELDNNKKIGQVCIIIGVLSLLFRYRDLFF